MSEPEYRPGKPPRHWCEMGEAERKDAVTGLGLPAFRADQISRHYFERHETDPNSWTDLPRASRPAVAGLFPGLVTTVIDRTADKGWTVKSLYRLFDGVLVESVLMRYPRHTSDHPGDPGHPAAGRISATASTSTTDRGPRSTLCVSSQAGCGIGCPFCATGQEGLRRNLSAAEIIEQVRSAITALESDTLHGGVGALNNVVFMGMGEPLANYKAVMCAIRAICSPVPHGFGISARGITVSTCGIVPRIEDLAAEGLPLTLAVSLHAPDDELRDELVPINKRWKVGEVLDAAYAYFETTGRRVSIEYAMMRDINDQSFRADLLASELNTRGRGWVHVNLIPLNPTPGSKWTASRARDEAGFIARLEAHRIPVTLRDTRGQDIDGACGQLAAKEYEITF